MHIELRPIATIRPYENNPRINDQAVDAVASSIREYNFRQPIVVDAEGVIDWDGLTTRRESQASPGHRSHPHGERMPFAVRA